MVFGIRVNGRGSSFGGLVVDVRVLIQSRIYWRGAGQRYIRPILKKYKNRNITIDVVAPL